MKLLGFDFETYYDSRQGYSLRKLNPAMYALDPRFEFIGCAFQEDVTATPYWVDGPDLERYFNSEIDYDDTCMVGHNLLFDACLASFKFNAKPRLWWCTLAHGRTLWQHKFKSLSLDYLSKALGLPPKGGTVHKVDGMTRQMIIDAGLYDEYVEYSLQDVSLATMLYDMQRPAIPPAEMIFADSVLRMATEPRLGLDNHGLAEHLGEVRNAKEQSLALAMFCGVGSKKDLMSNDKFAEVLRSLGVEPPTKVSLVTGKVTYAFAKSDEAFRDLEEHEDPHVQNVVAARLGHKSTIDETRAESMLKMSMLDYPHHGEGVFPVALKVSGAHTHRLSGDWKLNAQNWRRGGKIRDSVEAPEGYEVVVGDLSQIEARMNAVFCSQWDLVQQFRDKLDVYSIMATKIFGRTITKLDVPERFIGKTLVLGAGYGIGPEKYYLSLRAASRDQLGAMLPITIRDAEDHVNAYRETNWSIRRTWAILGDIIPHMMNPACDVTIGPVKFLHQKILLPSGLHLHYHNLRFEAASGNYLYDYAGRARRLYGPKLLENIVQALARIVISECLVRLRRLVKPLGGFLVHQVHDEIVCLFPKALVQAGLALLEQELVRSIPWMPHLPLACEVGHGDTYGSAK